jgi:carbonic anhydrase
MGRHPFTVVIRCSDPRLDRFFSEPNAAELLGIDQHDSSSVVSYITNVGGAMRFAAVDGPDIVSDVALLVEKFGDGRGTVVLTAHSECGGYEYAFSRSDEEIRSQQIQDLAHLAERLLAADVDLDVHAYYLDLRSGSVETVTPGTC